MFTPLKMNTMIRKNMDVGMRAGSDLIEIYMQYRFLANRG